MESYIESKKVRLTVLKDIAASCGASALTGMPRNPSQTQSKMTEAACKAIDLENEIKQDAERLQQEKVFLLELIGQIDSTEYQTVLISRYFKGASWTDIASKMFYSERWIFELHGRALKELDELIERRAA